MPPTADRPESDRLQRLVELLRELYPGGTGQSGVDESRAARELGWSQATLNRTLHPERSSRGSFLKLLDALAREKNLSRRYVEEGLGAPFGPAPAQGDPPEAPAAPARGGRVEIPLVAVRASGDEPFEVELPAYRICDREQLRGELGFDPGLLVVLVVPGAAMLPTLAAGDRLYVRRYAGEPLPDGAIGLFRNSRGGLLLRRVYWSEEGGMQLRADASEAPPLQLRPERTAEWRLIGTAVRVEKAL